MLVSRHASMLMFHILLLAIFELATNKPSVFFILVYASNQHTNIININKNLMCTIYFQALLLCLNLRECVL